jgi:hypothetical protein
MLVIRNYLIGLALVACHSSFAQMSFPMLDSVSGQLIKNIRSKQTEALFILTDKSIYKTGESIWFRSILLRSASQKMSRVSKNIFVELINDYDSVVYSLLLDGDRLQSGARIYVGPKLATGFYWLKAYTRYMALKEPDKIPMQPLYIANSGSPGTPNPRPARVNNNNQPAITVNFFPEGGTVVTGANSTVALHITDANEAPVALTGHIKDNRDSLITSFTTDKYGLAKFDYFPTRGRNYTAQLTWEGKKFTFPLPGYNFHAGQLSITKQSNGDRKIRVLLEDSIYQKNYRTYLVGIGRDSLYFASVGTGMYEVIIPARKLSHGIMTFYLVNDDLKVLSERSIYNGSSLAVTASLDKNIYQKRDKAELSIEVTDGANFAIPSSLSIAIVDSNFVHAEPADEIVSAFFETKNGSLFGNWNLANTTGLDDEQMDLLMMTRNGSFNDIMLSPGNNQEFLSSDNDSLLYVRGTAVYNNNEKPASGKIATIFSSSGKSTYGTDTTTTKGQFVFPLTEYPDSTQFFIQILNQRGNPEQATVSLDTLKFPTVNHLLSRKKFTVKQSSISKYFSSYFDETSARGSELSPVTVEANKKKKPKYDENKRVSKDSKIVTHDDFGKGGANRVANAMQRVPGFQIIGGYVAINGLSGFGSNANTEPIVLVDGVQAALSAGGGFESGSPVLNFLNSLNADDVSFIEVLTGPEAATLGVRGKNGAILINTGSTDMASSNQMNIFSVRGYHTPPPFLMPDYDLAKNKTLKFNDLRSTLFWQSGSSIDSTGKVKIPFFTSDVASAYKIVIRGITSNGDIIYKTLDFKTQ